MIDRLIDVTDFGEEELIAISCAVAVILLILVIIVVVVARTAVRDRRKAARSRRTPAVVAPAADNWSIPRPHPRVWQTSASMLSSGSRRKRPHHVDVDDDNVDEDLELRRPSRVNPVQPLHRTSTTNLDQSLGLASRPTEQDDVGQLRTPRLRRYVSRQYCCLW